MGDDRESCNFFRIDFKVFVFGWELRSGRRAVYFRADGAVVLVGVGVDV